MANINTKKGVIGILTGGGDVPGLNPAIRGVTFRALREGYEVIGFRRGWAGLVEMVRDHNHDNSENFPVLRSATVQNCRGCGRGLILTNPASIRVDNNLITLCRAKRHCESPDSTPERFTFSGKNSDLSPFWC